jgi:hypothetical protein
MAIHDKIITPPKDIFIQIYKKIVQFFKQHSKSEHSSNM